MFKTSVKLTMHKVIILLQRVKLNPIHIRLNLLLDTCSQSIYISSGLEMVKRIKASKRILSGDIPYGKRNYQLFFAGLACIIIGYLLMWNSEVYGQQALTVSILFLAVGYLILIPIAIIYKEKKNSQNEAA